jgi:hypothetical protein
MSQTAIAMEDLRADPRDEVHQRARATRADGRLLTVLVVNISAGGLMARSEAPFASGDRLTVQLPAVGSIGATVRWALGGRIGCQFDGVISAVRYRALLDTVGRI